MPSKKLPNRVEGLFEATRSIVKDGRRGTLPAVVHPPERLQVLPPDLEASQSLTGWSWEIDAAGRYISCSAEIESLLGFAPQTILGKALAEPTLSQPRPGEPGLPDILRAARPFSDVRWQAQCQDGRGVWLVSSGFPLHDEEGRLTGYHGVTYLAGPAEPREVPPPATPAPAPEVPAVVAPAAGAALPTVELPLPEAQPQPAAQPVAAPPEPQIIRGVAAARGYLDGPEGLAPLEESVVLPEIGEAIAEGRLIQKVSDPATAREGEEQPAGRSLATPIRLKDQILGALDFFDPDKTQAWSEDDLALAQTVADQLALALENARLFNESRIQQRNATYLARATQAVGRALSEQELWDILADELLVAYHPERVLISQWDVSANTLTPLAMREGAGASPRAGFGMVVTLAGQPPEVVEVLQSRRGQITHPAPHQIAMLQPLIYSDAVECLVEVTSTQAEGFNADDLQLLGSMLSAAASALRTVRLYDLQRQTAERLTEMDKVKSQFLANMSHELRTPLNSIIGFSRVILKGIDGPLTDQQAQDLTSIYNSGRHLLELINDILDMSKIEAGKMEMVFEEVDLRDILKGVMSTAVGLVKDKPAVALKEEVADPLPTVKADATRVRQVLINLISNASKFTDSGSITLRARPIEERDPRTNRMTPYLQLSVQDSGAGIAEKDMHKLFEAFSQVDSSPTRKVGGTGLGLSICRRMIEMHGGRIWAESQEGRGSTFSFILPVYKPEPPPTPSSQGGPPVILVVEDDQGIVGLYRRYLEPHGYSVICMDKSSDAVSGAVEYRPAAILLDVIMPQRDGWRVLADLKQNVQTRDIPVIICTIVSDRERALNMGAADYLNKPILEADLLQALDKVWLPRRVPVAADAAG
jgi:signal transduction histidine kinase/ActR/RegA family two-component response regulator